MFKKWAQLPINIYLNREFGSSSYAVCHCLSLRFFYVDAHEYSYTYTLKRTNKL